VSVRSVDDVDDEVRHLLRVAYEQDGQAAAGDHHESTSAGG
jgi:hypothetical protein